MSLRSWVSAVSLPSRLRAIKPASLCLQFPIFKMGMMTVPTSLPCEV